MSASDNSMPGGQPSTTQPSATPWLSPKVVTINDLPNELPDTLFLQLFAGQQEHTRAALLELDEVTLDPRRSQPPRGLVFRKPPAVTAIWTRP